MVSQEQQDVLSQYNFTESEVGYINRHYNVGFSEEYLDDVDNDLVIAAIRDLSSLCSNMQNGNIQGFSYFTGQNNQIDIDHFNIQSLKNEGKVILFGNNGPHVLLQKK